MPSVALLPKTQLTDLQARMKRVEGQTKGVQRMIDEGRDCVEVLNQIAAIRAALNSVSGELLECYAIHCLQHPDEFPSQHAAVEAAVRAVTRSSR